VLPPDDRTTEEEHKAPDSPTPETSPETSSAETTPTRVSPGTPPRPSSSSSSRRGSFLIQEAVRERRLQEMARARAATAPLIRTAPRLPLSFAAAPQGAVVGEGRRGRRRLQQEHESIVDEAALELSHGTSLIRFSREEEEGCTDEETVDGEDEEGRDDGHEDEEELYW
jgi:hypothetical protein